MVLVGAYGLATAIRPVGIALILPYMLHVYEQSTSVRQFACRGIVLLPVVLSGLLGYMIYQQVVFDTPFAFVQTQSHWHVRPTHGMLDKVLSLVSLEPIWSSYRDIFRDDVRDTLAKSLFSLEYTNPVYFLGTAVLIAVGGKYGWLTRGEIALSVMLLLIPYWTRSYEWLLFSHGRFAAVAFPVYIVSGKILERMPSYVVVSIFALAGWGLGLYAALFVAGAPLY